MPVKGLIPHLHKDRTRVIHELVPLWKEKFGSNLVAIAADASYARGDDRSYSDLELEVFLDEMPPEGEDQYFQRIVDGMLIEAIYTTRENYLKRRVHDLREWYIAGSSRLIPILNDEFVLELNREIIESEPGIDQLDRQAVIQVFNLQESFGKVLNAIDDNNREGLGLLLFGAVLQALVMVSFLNRAPYTTFSMFIHESRSFSEKPIRFDELLDVIVYGTYQSHSGLQGLLLDVYEGFENILQMRALPLYNGKLDPTIPNILWENVVENDD